MFGDGFKFPARIRRGAAISQDFRFGLRWPKPLAPSDRPEADPDLLFTAEDCGHYFSLVAAGYGLPGDYGNGSIFVDKLSDLIIPTNKDRDALLEKIRARKQKKVDEAEAELAKAQAELEGAQP